MLNKTVWGITGLASIVGFILVLAGAFWVKPGPQQFNLVVVGLGLVIATYTLARALERVLEDR